MLRSLMTAVTGVRAHQTMLDVTGNNIANANTTGFKKDATIFADLMYQANKYASGAGDTRGGINPAQVGLGVSVSAIETIHTQGSGSYTGNPSDMMIQDKGFFVYSDGNSQLFSRSGALVLDANSDMVMSGQGYKLQGYKMEETPLEGYQQAADLSTVNIPLGQKIDAKATTRVDYQCNLDSRSDAYLSYGFADLPFNVTAGWKGNSTGTAIININGTDYDMSFTTDFEAQTNADTSGVHYLDVTIANGDNSAVITFDMVNVDSTTGLPKLALPKLNAPTGTATAVTGSLAVGTGSFVGWLSPDMTFIDNPADVAAATVQDVLDTYIPVYQLPGQVPPEYVAAQYDDATGSLKLRHVEFTPDDPAAPVLDTDSTNIKANPTLFTYNIKDNMKYTSFQLEGNSTLEGDDDPTHVGPYNFIAEFDESITVGTSAPSELSKTSSKMTLWYYGLSNGDGADATATRPAAVHKLDATVYFNADGTFDSVEWDSVNDDAPLGYRIVDDADWGAANFRISAGQSSSTSSKTDTLVFEQAQNLDDPANKWNAQGTVYQGGYHATKLTIYDDNGKEHTLEVTFKKITENRWRWEAFLVEQNEFGEDVLSNVIPSPSSGEIEFDGSGRISNAVTGTDSPQRRGDGNDRYPNAEVELTIPFSLNGQPNSVLTLNFGGGVGSGGSALDGVTQFASETTTKPVYQDGYTMGVLKNYSVAQNGLITGAYDNGVNIPLYRVVLATFTNEQGLEKVGNTMFRASVNSGNPNIDGATTNGKGSIMSQYVEMSNVDLTEEFTHLIIAQRGFQANARTVTVSDQILEEVVNLKR